MMVLSMEWIYSDMCAYVEEFCGDNPAGLINYLHFYFCSLGSLHAFALILMVIWMIFLFALVGVAASDFFYIFSTFSAFNAGSGTLAVGEIVGAASFITSIVVGSMTIIKPFKVSRAPFFRDTLYLTGCIIFMLYMVVTKTITFVQSVLLIAVYVSYVSIVLFADWRRKRAISRQALAASGSDSTTERDGSNNRNRSESDDSNSVKRDEEAGTPTVAQERTTATTTAEPEEGHDYIASEFGTQMVTLPMRPVLDIHSPSSNPSYHPKAPARRCPAIVIDTTNSSATLLSHDATRDKKRNSEYSIIISRSSDENNHLGPSLDDDPNHDPSYPQLQQALLHHSLILPDRHDPTNKPKSPIFLEPPGGSFQNNIPAVSYRRRFVIIFRDWIKPVYFPTLLGWNEKSWILRVLAVGSIPIVLLLTLTLPVVDIAEDDKVAEDSARQVQHAQDPFRSSEDTASSDRSRQEGPYNGWCQIATMIQMVIAPVFMTAVITSAAGESYVAILIALGVGIVLSGLIFNFSTEEEPPRFYEALAFFGFLVSMAWIFIVANEVVGILQAFGMILGVSDAILGLTVFAMGNSLGDLVANITIAKMGFPRMAFSACFGGPLLNMLLGVGICGTYVTLKTGADIPLQISPTLLVSSGGVLVTMLAGMVVVPRSGYVLRRWWGFFLVGVYVVCMVTNVILEVKMTPTTTGPP
ncbi:hypothetical protein BGZ58_004907 [Dissophora ornata]|nr:hypothetical protein BGZ58_004907 [Dissophora ornata]